LAVPSLLFHGSFSMSTRLTTPLRVSKTSP